MERRRCCWGQLPKKENQVRGPGLEVVLTEGKPVKSKAKFLPVCESRKLLYVPQVTKVTTVHFQVTLWLVLEALHSGQPSTKPEKLPRPWPCEKPPLSLAMGRA